MKNAFKILFFLISNYFFSQEISVNKIFVRNNFEKYKRFGVELIVDNIKLDSLHSMELQGNSVAVCNSKKKYSDNFYTDKYFEKKDNKYVIVFDSINNKILNFERLSGILKYISLSEKNKSILNIKTQNIESKILDDKNTDIKIAYLNAFELDKIQNKNRILKRYINKYSSKFKLNKIIFSDAIRSFLKHRYEFKIPKNLSEDVIFYAENPKYKVIDIVILDKNNKKISRVTSEHHSEKWTVWEEQYFDGEKLPNDFTVKVLLENKESIELLDFDFKNIKLE